MHILFVDDCLEDVEIACWHLLRSGLVISWDVVQCESQLLAAVKRRAPDVIVSDHHMPGFDGWHALRAARTQAPNTPFIFHCGSPEALRSRAVIEGAHACADKERHQELVELINELAVAPATVD